MSPIPFIKALIEKDLRLLYDSLRAGSRLGFMREIRDASGEATRRAAKPRERGARWAARLVASPLASRISRVKPNREPARRLGI